MGPVSVPWQPTGGAGIARAHSGTERGGAALAQPERAPGRRSSLEAARDLRRRLRLLPAVGAPLALDHRRARGLPARPRGSGAVPGDRPRRVQGKGLAHRARRPGGRRHACRPAAVRGRRREAWAPPVVRARAGVRGRGRDRVWSRRPPPRRGRPGRAHPLGLDRPATALCENACDLPPVPGTGLPRGLRLAGRAGRRPDRQPGHPAGPRVPRPRRLGPRPRAILAGPDPPLARWLRQRPSFPLLGRRGGESRARRRRAARGLPGLSLGRLPVADVRRLAVPRLTSGTACSSRRACSGSCSPRGFSGSATRGASHRGWWSGSFGGSCSA